MSPIQLSDLNCSVARSLDVIGERWTLLVLRDAFNGVRRFEEFAASLPVARNVLTARLRTLVEHGVLEVRVTNTPARRLYEYFGFRQAGILKGYYKDNNEDAYVMLSGPLDDPLAIARHAALRETLRAHGIFEDLDTPRSTEP